MISLRWRDEILGAEIKSYLIGVLRLCYIGIVVCGAFISRYREKPC